MSTFLTRGIRNTGERTETYESACVEGLAIKCIALTSIELGYCQKYRTKDVDRAKDVDFRVITDSLHNRVKTRKSLKNNKSMNYVGHLHMDFSINKWVIQRYSIVNLFSLPNFLFSSLLFVKIHYIIHTTYKTYILLVRLLVNGRLLVVVLKKSKVF